jgi:hypothetical protein
MSKLQIDVSSGANKLEVKFPSMPMTTKASLKGHSRMSSTFSDTNASSVQTDRYHVPADRLDWNVPTLGDKHKALYFACNKYK